MTDKLYFAKVKPEAIIPSKRSEDAGLDLYSCFEEECMIIEPHTSKLIPTGLASAFSEAFVMVLMERGSTGSKNIKRNCGVIDSGYRNEIFVCLYNGNDKPVVITKETDQRMLGILSSTYIVYPYSKAIAQALMIEVPKIVVEETSYENLLSIESIRGLGKLGDSGK